MVHPPHHAPLRFGLIADPQYADVEPADGRYYRASLKKLRACAEDLNAHDLCFVLHLGDAIDRDFASFDAIMAVFRELRPPVLHTPGNHDYEVRDDAKPRVPAALGLAATRYSRRDLLPGWRIVVLDGTTISTFAHAAGTPAHAEAQRLCAALTAEGLPQAKPWNGGLGAGQLAWLDAELAAADAARERALIACHFPAFPVDSHNLLDDAALLAVIDRHPCVSLYVAGHHHAGGHAVRDGVHYLTLRGMVETEDATAYAVAELFADRLVVHGRGREPSRDLPLRAV